jgi:DNA/RNA-binding domain of Phe-tRNA-synthetase-like protein
VKKRLEELSNRFSGPQAIHLRHQSIPWAYRVFYRHIGLDPDQQPTPVEAIALERMKRGGFISRSLLDDALTIAIIESGVALRAFDAERVEGGLGIRPTEPGEGLEGRPGALPAGALVIADQTRPLGLLFGATASGRGVTPRTRSMVLVGLQVKGVPEIAVQEAIWLAVDVIRA